MKHPMIFFGMKRFQPLFIRLCLSIFTLSLPFPTFASQIVKSTAKKTLELALHPETAGERRQLTIKRYAKKNNYTHLNNMFLDKNEIAEIYKDDVKIAEAYDQNEELQLSSPQSAVPIAKIEPKTSPKPLKRLIKKSTKFNADYVSDLSDTMSLSSEDSDDSLDGFIVPNHYSDSESISEEEVLAPLKKFKTPQKRKLLSLDEHLTEKPPLKKQKSENTAQVPKKEVIPFINGKLNYNMGGIICFYDTETTAIHSKCGGRVCEFAGLMTINGIPRKTIHLYFNPDMKSWYGAYQAHGLGDTFLRAQAPFYKVAKHVEDFFGKHMRCGHNGHTFDDTYINYELTRAWIFYHFKSMIDPSLDLTRDLPSTVQFDPEKIKRGHEKLKSAGILKTKTTGPAINIDQLANSLAAAGMLYYFKDHMSQDFLNDPNSETGQKHGPLMFANGRIFPDPEKNPKNYVVAAQRLAHFRLIRIPMDTLEQRKKLELPHEKPIRDAISNAEVYLKVIQNLFEEDILNEETFKTHKIDFSKMFDTLCYVREHKDIFTRGISMDNHKLDSLLDYYGINRYDRESGNHGAGIDTHLLYQAVRKIFNIQVKPNSHMEKMLMKPQKEQEAYFFKKNSITFFDKDGIMTDSTLLHDDKIGQFFGDPNKHKAAANYNKRRAA